MTIPYYMEIMAVWTLAHVLSQHKWTVIMLKELYIWDYPPSKIAHHPAIQPDFPSKYLRYADRNPGVAPFLPVQKLLGLLGSLAPFQASIS